MTEPAVTPTAATTPPVAPPVIPAPPAAEAPPPEPPPWGDDFDPARAWHTIQSLREKEKELAKQPRLTPEQQRQLQEYNQLVEASKSEAQRQQEAVENAKREADTARAEAIRYKAAATHGISADHFDLLGSGTEEEINARAEKISALVAAQVAAAPTAPPTTRPVEQLRPGATPAGTESEEDVIYATLFGRPT